MSELRSGESSGYTALYHCDQLMWFARFADPLRAITREKEMKGWTRARKIALTEQENRAWMDLSTGWGVPVERFGSTAGA